MESGRVSLQGASAGAPVVLVILMGDYRSNGPYSCLMKHWVRWWQAYREFGLKECHILTTSSDAAHPSHFPAGWEEGELAARASGAPTALLFDEAGAIQYLANDFLGGISGNPCSVLLRGRRVLLNGVTSDLDDVSILNALRCPYD